MSLRTEAAEGVVVPKGFQRIASFSTLQSAPLTVPDGCYFAMIQAETNDCYYRDDGTAPTASIGFRLYAGAIVKYTGGPAGLKALQFIPATGSAILNVLYYGSP